MPEPSQNTLKIPDRKPKPDGSDQDELRYPATISVLCRWFILAVCLVQLLYRPPFTQEQYIWYGIFLAIVSGVNLTLQYRLRYQRPITRPVLLTASTIDLIMISASGSVGGGFENFFFHLIYYPALAMVAVIFPSFRLTFAAATLVGAVYTAISILVGSGLDLAARDEKALFGRVAIMYAVVTAVTLVARFEQERRRRAVERERQLESDRIAISQNIHNTIAQSAYMIGLGIETARELADQSNQDLMNTLQAIQDLSTSTTWELRHPIDMGLIFRGQGLGEVIRSHTGNFTSITNIPTSVLQSGEEPVIPAITKGVIFSIAHNALTNAFRHSHAALVTVRLNFGQSQLTISIEDDGIGLPHDYLERGHGFRNMKADAERIGGVMNVGPAPDGTGTTVTCTIPYEDN